MRIDSKGHKKIFTDDDSVLDHDRVIQVYAFNKLRFLYFGL